MRVTPRDAVSGRGARASVDLGRLEAVYESKHAPEGPGEDKGWLQLQAATLKAMQQKVGWRGSCSAVWAVETLCTAAMLPLPQQLSKGHTSCRGSGAGQALGVQCIGHMLAAPPQQLGTGSTNCRSSAAWGVVLHCWSQPGPPTARLACLCPFLQTGPACSAGISS